MIQIDYKRARHYHFYADLDFDYNGKHIEASRDIMAVDEIEAEKKLRPEVESGFPGATNIVFSNWEKDEQDFIDPPKWGWR